MSDKRTSSVKETPAWMLSAVLALIFVIGLVVLGVIVFGILPVGKATEPADVAQPDAGPPAELEAKPQSVDWRKRFEQIKQIQDAEDRLAQYIALRDSLDYFSEDQTELMRQAMMHFNAMDNIDFQARRMTGPGRRTYVKLFVYPPDPSDSNVNHPIHDLTALTGMRIEYLKLHDLPNLRDYSTLATMQVSDLWLEGNTHFTDITLLNHMTGLTRARLSGCGLTSLAGMDFKADMIVLELGENEALTSIEGIQGTKVKDLRFNACKQLVDLSPLAGVQGLESLDMRQTGALDLSVLAQLKLKRLSLNRCKAVRPLIGEDAKQMREYLAQARPAFEARTWRQWLNQALPNTSVSY